MGYDVGDTWTPQVTVKNAAGTLTAATVALTIVAPDGTSSAGSVTTPSTGLYQASVVVDQAGRWVAYWDVTGAVTESAEDSAYVRRRGASVIRLADVRARLNKSLTVDDDEIEDMIDAALSEYEEFIGPVSGSVTETHDGGRDVIVLRQPVNAITAASYDSGADLAYTDLVVENGIVRWGYGTAGRFGYGRVSITYAAPALPANHRELIIADVAGYFEATQRSTGAGQADFPGEGGFEAPYASTPAVLFPRIRALATRFPAIA